MSIQLGPQGDYEITETADINVTPFIDVILVLLIIFMVAAPLSTVDVPVELPTSSAKTRADSPKPVYVTVKADASLTLGEEAVARDRLGAAIDATTGGNKDERIFLRADKTVSYGELMQVMNLLRSSGYLKIGLIGLEETGR